MKKQTLLGAIALTTLAVGAAGAANAQQYTVVSKATTGATVVAPITVATEAKASTALNTGVVGHGDPAGRQLAADLHPDGRPHLR